MPRLTFPRSMIDLEGKTLDGTDMQENFKAINGLVDNGVDWENIEQWSLDTHHVGHGSRDPHKGVKFKSATSLHFGYKRDVTQRTLDTGEWFSFSITDGLFTPQVPGFHCEEGAGIFFVGSVVAYPPSDCRMLLRAMIRPPSGTWQELWRVKCGRFNYAYGAEGLVAAHKATKSGVYKVDVQARFEAAPGVVAANDFAQFWSDGQVAVFVVNR